MYTIIFQGILSKSVIPNILQAKKYTNDIILSTWKNQNDPELVKIIEDHDIKVIELDDPKTIVSFEQNNIDFYFNIKRHLYGVYEATKIARFESVFKCRCDLSLDFNKFYEIFKSSGRNIAALNWATVNPYKIFSLPYFYHISDWCYLLSRKRILSCLKDIQELSEHKYIIDPITIGNIRWSVGLAPEQLMTLIYSHKVDYKSPDSRLFNNYTNLNFKKKLHEECLKNFINVSRDHVKAKSTKYNGRSLRWIMYKDALFNDKSFTLDIHNLFLYMLRLILNK